MIASAILDRLLHHATINIKADSYRLRAKRKAGLTRTALTAHSEPGRPPGGEFETITRWGESGDH